MSDFTGALFKNENKKGEKSPDYTGKIMVNGAKYNIAGWKNKSKSGLNYIKIKINDVANSTVEDFPPIEDEVF